MDLEPEFVDTYEAQIFYHTDKIQSSLTYYSSRMTNLITRKYFPDASLTPPFYLKYLNVGSWDFRGLEFEGKYSLSENFLATIGLSYQTNENEAGIEDATLHPNYAAKVGLLYTQRRFSIGVFNSCFSQPKDTITVNPESDAVNKVPEANNFLSAELTFKINKNFMLSLQADNLLDQDMRYPDFPNKQVNSLIPLNGGRTFYGTLTCNF